MALKRVVVALKPETAEKYVEKGYIPIETSYGTKTVTDAFKLDHHGELSGLVNPAKRAREELFCKGNGTYVVSHLDLDTVLTIAGLECIKVDADLVELVSILDIRGPHAVEWEKTRWAPFLTAFWKIFGRIVFKDEEDVTELVEKALELVKNAKKLERSETLKKGIGDLESDLESEIKKGLDEVVGVKTIKVDDPEIERVKVGLAIGGESKAGFKAYYEKADIVVAYNRQLKKVSIGLKDSKFTKLFGPKGLLEIIDYLNVTYGFGWGGRETIIGSPRDKEVSEQVAREIYDYIIGYLQK
jgi:hypothetical protein